MMSPLNIVLQEDLTIRGGAQLWLMNCGASIRKAGHQVTFILPETSLLLEDLHTIQGATVETYDTQAIANDPDAYKERFTSLLAPAHVCVTLVRQQRGNFQNVNFIATCIADANLSTYLIAKTGTPDPTYKNYFYGGPLLEKQGPRQCSVITIAQYTKDFLVQTMGLPEDLITNVYNGTDTTKFQRSPDMAVEARKRYPCVEGAYVIGCIGSFEERKAQSLLLKAGKKLIDDKRLPNIYMLFVGEGPDRDMLANTIEELGLTDNACLCDFSTSNTFVAKISGVSEHCLQFCLNSIGSSHFLFPMCTDIDS
jgi:glycosyltransferase involved in cell wall biosynthesis